MRNVKVMDILNGKDHLTIGKWYEFPEGWLVRFYSMDNLHPMRNHLCFWTSANIKDNTFRYERRWFNIPYDYTIKEVRKRRIIKT